MNSFNINLYPCSIFYMKSYDPLIIDILLMSYSIIFLYVSGLRIVSFLDLTELRTMS